MMHIAKPDDLIENFLSSMLSERGLSKNTYTAYKSDLSLFFQSIKKPALDVTHEDVISYVTSSKAFSAKTNNRRLAAIKGFFKFLVSEHILKENPASDVESAKTKRNIPRVLSEEQLIDLIEACDRYEKDAVRFKLIVILLYSSGVRVSELLSLKTNMIDYENSIIRVIGKGQKERMLPIDPSVISLIKALNISGYLFVSKRTGETLTRQRIFQIIKQLGLDIGVPNLSPHKIRHSFATHMLNHGADILTLQKLLGHSDASTTEIYTHVLSDKLLETIKKCHPMAS